MANEPHILVVGSINMDLVVRCPRVPAPGETLAGSDFATVPGGKGANQAVAAARLGAPTAMIGRVGLDTFGDALLAGLAENGVDTTHVARDDEAASGIALILVDHAGQNSIVVASGANGSLRPEDLEAAGSLFAWADAVLVQLEVPLATVGQALALARRAGALAVLDAGPARELPAEVLAAADIVSPNESEAKAITGLAVSDVASAQRAAARLREMGARGVVLKLGAQGAYLSCDEMQQHVPAFRVEPVDTTAAGDAFTAALALAAAMGRTLPEAVRYANAAGAAATLRFGAQPSMPTPEEVIRILQGGRTQ
jgi:ribokinase